MEGEMLETTRSWPEFTRTLGATLPLLDDGDTLIFSHDCSYAQCQMAEVWHVEVAVPFPMRMSDDEGVRLAEMMVSALRDVHGIERVDLLEEREFNALY
jgi:hypothetical protein